MNQQSISILVAAAIVAGAILYSNGMFNPRAEELPFDAAMKAKMVDPDSVQYRNIEYDTSFGKYVKNPMVCGQVNAKNRLGGYSGWEKFVAIDPNQDNSWQIYLEREVAGEIPVWCQ